MDLVLLIDNDGHAHAVERTVANLRKIVRYLQDADMLEDPVGNWIDDPELSIDKIEGFMQKSAPLGRSGGGMLHFVESITDLKMGHNPFQ